MWESLLPLCSWFLSRTNGFMTACYGDIYYISLPSLFFLGTQPICFPGGIYFYYFSKCPSAWIYTFNPSWLSPRLQCSLSLNGMINFWDFSYGLIAFIVWWVVGAVCLLVWVYLKVPGLKMACSLGRGDRSCRKYFHGFFLDIWQLLL